MSAPCAPHALTVTPFELLANRSLSGEGSTTREERARIIAALRQYVAEHGAIPEPSGIYHHVVDQLARAVEGHEIRQREEELRRMGDALQADGWTGGIPEDVPRNRWTTHLRAALLFGVALGIAGSIGGEQASTCDRPSASSAAPR